MTKFIGNSRESIRKIVLQKSLYLTNILTDSMKLHRLKNFVKLQRYVKNDLLFHNKKILEKTFLPH